MKILFCFPVHPILSIFKIFIFSIIFIFPRIILFKHYILYFIVINMTNPYKESQIELAKMLEIYFFLLHNLAQYFY